MSDQKQSLPPGSNLWFTSLFGDDMGRRYQVQSLPAIIGPKGSADVGLAAGGISKNHARLVLSGNQVFLEDLGTGGNTKVNNMAVKRTKLQNGDIIEIGDARLLLQLYLTAEKIPEKKPSAAVDLKDGSELWAAGFSDQFRDWFDGELKSSLKAHTRSFRTGEEVLVALNEELSQDRAPSMLILDLRLPLMNGINVAVATRAFELGFNREDRIPIVFLFSAPDQASFEKVVKFCQPLQVVDPGDGEKELKQAARKAVKSVKG